MMKADDRTKAQKATHYWGVVATDKFLSGWGLAKGGLSKCCWACDSIDTAERVERHVRNRSEMRYVNIVDLRTYKVRNCAHWHVYVVDAEHPYAK